MEKGASTNRRASMPQWPSSQRRPGPPRRSGDWIPACAGMSSIQTVRADQARKINRAEEKLLRLQAADENADQVCVIWRFQPALSQRLYELRRGDRLEVGTDKDPGDGGLDAGRLGDRIQPRQLLQTFRIGNALACERLQGAHLRLRFVHARDSRRNDAQLIDVRDRLVLQINPRS